MRVRESSNSRKRGGGAVSYGGYRRGKESEGERVAVR